MTQKPGIPRDLEFYFPFLCPETRLHFSGLFPKTQVQLPFFKPFIRPRLSDFSSLPRTRGRPVFRAREKGEREEERHQTKNRCAGTVQGEQPAEHHQLYLRVEGGTRLPAKETAENNQKSEKQENWAYM